MAFPAFLLSAFFSKDILCMNMLHQTKSYGFTAIKVSVCAKKNLIKMWAAKVQNLQHRNSTWLP